MRRTVSQLVLLGLVVLVVGCQPNTNQEAANSNATPAAVPAPVDPIGRGKYLAIIMGCNDCHTPMTGMGPEGPIFDQSKFLAGHPSDTRLPEPPPIGAWWISGVMTAWSGPWGISYAANLTPDSLTGIGIWTEDIFIQAMRTGRHAGVARPILPPMPWPAVAALTDEDIKSLYAYLRSIPAVSNEVPQAVILAPPPAPEGSH